MITKKVNRYYCEFCKKSKGTKYSMEVHERHCTMNPNRICRMCQKMQGSQVSMKELIAEIPVRDIEYPVFVDGLYDEATKEYEEGIKQAIKTLREITSNCPVCIMAALRQAKVDPIFWEGFNFKEEMASAWIDYHANDHEENFY